MNNRDTALNNRALDLSGLNQSGDPATQQPAERSASPASLSTAPQLVGLSNIEAALLDESDTQTSKLLTSISTNVQRQHITPLDVQHQEFQQGWRGYRKSEVRAHLAQVAQALEGGLRERAALEQHIQELRRQIQEFKNAEDELRRTVVAAERIGHDLKEQARQEAMLTIQTAEDRSSLMTEAAKNREQEALSRHESRLRELESTFSTRRAQLEGLYQTQEHDLENRARERSASLEREFSTRHADLSGRLSSAHTEYAQFMSQYRAVSQAFAQAANSHLIPDNVSLPSRQISPLDVSPRTFEHLAENLAQQLQHAGSDSTELAEINEAAEPEPMPQSPELTELRPEVAAVQIEEQRF